MLAFELLCNSVCGLLPKIWRALVYVNWIDSHRRVNKGVTVGNCRRNCWLFAEELVFGTACMDLLNRVFSTHLIGFLLRATKQEQKSALKRLRHCVSQNAEDSVASSARERNSTAAGGDVQVAWGGIHE